jgi:hypothetical protein
VYFDLTPIKGRTYEAGIKLDIKTEHIICNSIYYHYGYGRGNFEYMLKYMGFPKIVFAESVHEYSEVKMPDDAKEKFRKLFDKTLELKNKVLDIDKKLSFLKGNDYKIWIKDERITVLAKIHSNGFEELLGEECYIPEFDVKKFEKRIAAQLKKVKGTEYINALINSEEYLSFVQKYKNYRGVHCNISLHYEDNCYDSKNDGIRFNGYVDDCCIYNIILKDNFSNRVMEFEDKVVDTLSKYDILLEFVDRINNCKNKLWKAEFSFNSGIPTVRIRINLKKVYNWETIEFYDCDTSSEDNITLLLENTMHDILNNLSYHGYKIIWEADNNE